jgi:hypothetical protein
MFAGRHLAAFAFVAAVATTAIAIGVAQAPAGAAIQSGPDANLSNFACSAPLGTNLADSYDSQEWVQGGHTNIRCYWTYKAGKVTPGGRTGFPCDFFGLSLPNSAAYFSSTSGTKVCSN